MARFPNRIPWVLVKWLFEQALARGELVAAHNLGYMFLHSHGVAVDHAEAFRLFELAEPLGLARTFELLSECYRAGLGTVIDPQRAADYGAKANAAALESEQKDKPLLAMRALLSMTRRVETPASAPVTDPSVRQS